LAVGPGSIFATTIRTLDSPKAVGRRVQFDDFIKLAVWLDFRKRANGATLIETSVASYRVIGKIDRRSFGCFLTPP
jgi:hypothetical protein